jgi:putative endonuclease
MFYYVYIIRSLASGKFYIGFSEDLRERIKSHNANKNLSTKNRGPWKLIFYEAYLNKYDALRREKYLKSTKGRTTIKSMLREYLENPL